MKIEILSQSDFEAAMYKIQTHQRFQHVGLKEAGFENVFSFSGSLFDARKGMDNLYVVGKEEDRTHIEELIKQ